MDEAKLVASLEGLEVREALYLGETVRLADPKDPEVRGMPGVRHPRVLKASKIASKIAYLALFRFFKVCQRA